MPSRFLRRATASPISLEESPWGGIPSNKQTSLGLRQGESTALKLTVVYRRRYSWRMPTDETEKPQWERRKRSRDTLDALVTAARRDPAIADAIQLFLRASPTERIV